MRKRERIAALRRDIVQSAEHLVYWLTEAQAAADAGNPGAAICLRSAARNLNVPRAFAAAAELRQLQALRS